MPDFKDLPRNLQGCQMKSFLVIYAMFSYQEIPLSRSPYNRHFLLNETVGL